MDFDQALCESAKDANLTATQVAAKVGRSEQSARQYMAGTAVPSGDIVLTLMREIPGLAERLGFKVLPDAA
jgi:hypothetical protein